MIALLGGTFDPVHYGHLRMALEASSALNAEQLRLIPCRQPPHRDQPGATPEQRVALLKLAIAGQANWQVDDRELRRSGPSYSIDTLIELRNEIGPQHPLCLILGRDAFYGWPNWHRWRELLDYAHCLVMARPGVAPNPPAVLQDLFNERRCTPVDLAFAPAGGIAWLESTQLEISATQIRQFIRSGQNPRYLLPDAVLDKIEGWGLYATPADYSADKCTATVWAN